MAWLVCHSPHLQPLLLHRLQVKQIAYQLFSHLIFYKKYIRKEATEQKMVWIGRVTILAALFVSILPDLERFTGYRRRRRLYFIQKIYGLYQPGVFAMFILGYVLEKNNRRRSGGGSNSGFLLSVLFNVYAPSWFGNEYISLSAYKNNAGNLKSPSMYVWDWHFSSRCSWWCWWVLPGPKVNPKAFVLDKSMFKLEPGTIAMIVITLLIISLL